MRFENYLALKFVVNPRKNRDLKSSSVLVVLSISLAVIFYLSAVGIMNGYIDGVMKLAHEIRTFHIQSGYPVSYDTAVRSVSVLSKGDGVRYAGFYRETNGVLSNAKNSTGLSMLRFVENDIFSKDAGLSRVIRLLSGTKDLTAGSILISERTARKLKLSVNGELMLISAGKSGSDKFEVNGYRVCGIFTTGFAELDEQIAYIGDVPGTDGDYTVYVKLDDYYKTRNFINKYEQLVPVILRGWEELNYNEYTALKFQRNIIVLIVMLVLIAALLNILNAVLITVHEKKIDVGVLKSCGVTPFRIGMVFLLKGVYLGLIGIIIGIGAGLLVMYNLEIVLKILSGVINVFVFVINMIAALFIDGADMDYIEFFSSDFYLDKLYTGISIKDILFLSIFTFMFSIAASVVPAVKGALIKPCEVLKNE